jgi:hypothetical protein
MAQHVVEAAGPPTDPPPSIGAHYIDSNNGDIYLGNGTASVDDWLLGGGAGATGGKIWTQAFEDNSFDGIVLFSENAGDLWRAVDTSPDSIGVDQMSGNGKIQTLGDVILVSQDF